MSTIYDTEPQPTASVILHTTSGEIAVELFAKQTPLASRNFLQHCLDGYYDDTIFHRLVPGFIVQGGDPTGTGHGGESIYDGGALAGDLDPWPMDQRRGANAGPQGVGFKDEFHSRLRFSRRGLLGMANEGAPDTNGSQFFFTLDKAEELTNRNTVFGRVAGPTIYNLTKIGQGEVQEGTERPLYPVKITRVEILTNPFADMRKTERDARRGLAPPAPQPSSAPSDGKKKNKRKKGVNKTLLSFGDEIEDDAEEEAREVDAARGKQKKAKVEKTDRPVSAERETPQQEPAQQAQPATALPSRAGPDGTASTHPPPKPASAQPDNKDKSLRESATSDSESESDRETTRRKPHSSALEKTNAEIAALKASMRRTVRVEPAPATEEKKSVLESLVPPTAARGKKLSRRHGVSDHDQRTLSILGAFTSKLGVDTNGHGTPPAAPSTRSEDGGKPSDMTESGDGNGNVENMNDVDGTVCDLHFIANCQSCRPWDQEAGGPDAGSDSEDNWMAHTLNCAADKLGKDLSYRKKAEDELIVIDPREKARTLQDEKKAARRDARGGRSWDQARHAQMVRASALSGRGAR
ncbi:peptidyl-prolyl cis trans isomerase [Niveomyces insectorum RCEF 264]|uniref:peptidylprolyl isomerase n=1 Tax=Niveomyces insectorum RCEF 264 TaxID=1081102 RepID=A0A167XUY1_9HYPO|nr:peptidyl-prolyl cis trans isomerase [Niveomyces insectorum RCEF 264]